jgi:hypothetical protein
VITIYRSERLDRKLCPYVGTCSAPVLTGSPRAAWRSRWIDERHVELCSERTQRPHLRLKPVTVSVSQTLPKTDLPGRSYSSVRAQCYKSSSICARHFARPSRQTTFTINIYQTKQAYSAKALHAICGRLWCTVTAPVDDLAPFLWAFLYQVSRHCRIVHQPVDLPSDLHPGNITLEFSVWPQLVPTSLAKRKHSSHVSIPLSASDTKCMFHTAIEVPLISTISSHQLCVKSA